jgi:hypothetical protein
MRNIPQHLICKDIKNERLRKEQNTLVIIPCWWDGKLERYNNNNKKQNKTKKNIIKLENCFYILNTIFKTV